MKLLRAQAEAYGASNRLTVSIDWARLSFWRAELITENTIMTMMVMISLQPKALPVRICVLMALCTASCPDTSHSDVDAHLLALFCMFLRIEALQATWSPAESA